MDKTEIHKHLKPKISVSGAAETGHCGESALPKALELGKEIVRQGAILVTGATTGFPLWVARGAKEEGGFVVGISPAGSEEEHVELYKLPLDYTDVIIYTGAGYSGRNLLLTRSADAVIVGCGRIGTINEFTVAFEDQKTLGVLEGEWATGEVIRKMITEGHRTHEKLVFETNPKELVSKVIDLINQGKKENYGVYTGGDGMHRVCTGPDCKVIL